MNVIADTNTIVRLLVGKPHPEDTRQAALVAEILENAETVVIPTHVFCEIVWVLFSTYHFTRQEVIAGIETVLELENLVYKVDEVAAGLQFLENGGDFADGVINHAGRAMLAAPACFISFDKKAVNLLARMGANAMLLEVKDNS